MKPVYTPFISHAHRDAVLYLRAFMPTDWPEQLRGKVDAYPATDLIFAPGQPDCFWEEEGGVPFRGQDSIKRRLDAWIMDLSPEDRRKFLSVGMAGIGKTTLMWIAAHKILQRRREQGFTDARFFELFPNQFESKEDLDKFVVQLQDGDVVFIDEIHEWVKRVGVEPLYPILADTGTPRYPLGKGEGTHFIPPTVCWLAATTEGGEIDGTNGEALRSRFIELTLERPSEDDLLDILLDQEFPIDLDAAYEIVLRSSGIPRELLGTYAECRVFARLYGSKRIELVHAVEAFEAIKLDENGLLPPDRAVIATLLKAPRRLTSGEVVYAMSENALCAASGVDRATYKKRVQPKLISNGYLTPRLGQCLTDKALKHYAYLAT